MKSRPRHPVSQQLLSGTYHRRRGHVGSRGRQERLAATQMSLQIAWTDIHTSDAVPGGRVPHSPLQQQRGGIVSVERRASAGPGPSQAGQRGGELPPGPWAPTTPQDQTPGAPQGAAPAALWAVLVLPGARC